MSLRRVVFALAVLSLFVGLASAQINQNQQLSCTVSSSSQPALRAESTHELVGDVLIQCSGGTQPPNPATTQVPVVDITVAYGTAITSRAGSSQSVGGTNYTPLDAALVIDDANSIAPANALAAGYGPGAGLVPCLAAPNPGQTAPAATCKTFSQLIGGYYVADSTGASGGNAANVYQGYLTGGGTSVTFYQVPLAPPVTTGIYRRYRIVNVRVAPGSSTISATVTPSGPNATLMNITGSSSATVGVGQTGFAYAVSNTAGIANTASIVSSCITPTVVPFTATLSPAAPQYSPYVALVTFTPQFNNAAKPQGAPTLSGAGAIAFSNAPAAGGAGGPYSVYGNFTGESEVVLPALQYSTSTGSNGNSAGTPGLADAGTRFKAVFAGLPSGNNQPKIYVSLYNVKSFTADNSGTADNPAVAQGAGATVAELSKGAAVGSAGKVGTEFDAFAAATGGASLNYTGTATDPVLVSLNVSSGASTAVWEVQNLKAGTKTAFTFAVYVVYGSATPTSTSATVTLSAAPVQPATQPSPANLVQVPSMVTTPVSGPVLNVVPCQTALLFPFVSTTRVTATQHWETGIAISNTGGDPWNSVPVPNTPSTTTTCTLTFFGGGVATGSSTFVPPVVTGPAIGPGQNWAFVASDPLATGTAPNVGFAGYMFAVCNFSYAHGFAFVEDNSPAGNAMGYLAQVVNNGNNVTRPAALSGEALDQ